MVIKKRLNYGINSFRFPAVPKAPRSVRRRNLHRKTVEDSQICAIELLASIAGKLLDENESSSASSCASGGKGKPAFGKDGLKQEQKDESKASEAECIHQGSCEDDVYVSQPAFQNSDKKFIMKGLPHVEADANLEGASVITNSDYLAKFGSGGKSLICESKTAVGNFFSKVDGGSPDYGESCVSMLENGNERAKVEMTGDLTIASTCELKDPVELHLEFPNSPSKVKIPLCGDPVPNASFSRHRNNVNLDTRDDDEKFSRRYKPNCNTRLNSSRPPPCLGDRRLKKLLMSKYWKVAPKLNDCEQSNADGGEPLYRKRKTCYQGERYKRDIFHKRRKLFNQSAVLTYDTGFNSESVSNSPAKGLNRNKSGSTAKLPRASAVSRSLVGRQASFTSKDSNVKFSIKSISVPELLIEFPETATIGLLKRTVMEAVTSILEDGLHVGILLQGKKIRDDDRTLLQTGISSKDNLDALGFTLEPSPVLDSLLSESPLPCDALQHSIGPPATSVRESEVSNPLPEIPSLSDLGNPVNSNHESVSSPPDILTDETIPNSRALVAVPAMSVDALVVVPVDQKIVQSELVQRRTRRPFSVSEVEALVYAVEDIGTGRWRDVKLRAFENANHRTYVDLKDKWKTLVHTAKISPQQRRGEPVPQELLDRVMAAHSYWTQHQANQPCKHQAETPNMTDTENDKFGVETGT